MLNPRLERFYEKIICEDFVVLYNFTNITLIPKIEQAILSSTSKSFGVSKSSVLQSFCAWRICTSQKSISTRARKSVALFNIRKETLLGLKVTLRKKALFSFLDKSLIFVLPIQISKKNSNRNQQIDSLNSASLKKITKSENENAEISLHVQSKTKPTLLTLPTFLKNMQRDPNKPHDLGSKESYCKEGKTEVFIPNMQSNAMDNFYLSPKRKNLAFLNKLRKNLEKQKEMPFIIDFSLSDNFSKSNFDQNYYFSDSNTKKTFLFLKKHSVNTNLENKGFFTISNRIALSFPEISSLSSFFDFLSGFSLTFSLEKSKDLLVFNLSREKSIKKQLLSAFGCPKR